MAIDENAIKRGLRDQEKIVDLGRKAFKRPDDGAQLLDEARTFIARFCAFPDDHALHAVTLWAAHAHMVTEFHTSPRLALLSPEPASGKTRVLEVLDLLVPESMFCMSASPAAVFRSLSQKQITLLVDECDAVFTKKGKDDTHEDLRGLLNTGYKRGATIPRCVGPKHEVQHFEVFCATALAGLGDLPDTIMTRAVIIRMRRRAPNETIEPFRTRKHEPEGHKIREKIAAWADLKGPAIGEAWPELPKGIVDRPAEVWEPLVAVADSAGGEWSERAREACKSLCEVANDRRVSLGIRLLDDLRTIFKDADALHTETIISRLCEGEDHGLDADAPWSEMYGKPISARGLASMLKPYGVTSQKVKLDGKSLQGYRRASLWDAWTRYLPVVPAEAEPMEPAEPLGAKPPEKASNGEGSGVPEVPGARNSEKLPEPSTPHETRPDPEVPEVPDMRETESGPALTPGNGSASNLTAIVRSACEGTSADPEEVMEAIRRAGDAAEVLANPTLAEYYVQEASIPF